MKRSEDRMKTDEKIEEPMKRSEDWKDRGFIALMKKKIPGLVAVHCIIHRQHLVARNLSAELHHSLNVVIKCINKIKARSHNDRLF